MRTRTGNGIIRSSPVELAMRVLDRKHFIPPSALALTLDGGSKGKGKGGSDGARGLDKDSEEAAEIYEDKPFKIGAGEAVHA